MPLFSAIPAVALAAALIAPATAARTTWQPRG